MSDDPLKKIEDEQHYTDVGKMGYLIFKGATDAGADPTEAHAVTQCYFTALSMAATFTGLMNEDSEDKDNE
jgi:hypothetical protein